MIDDDNIWQRHTKEIESFFDGISFSPDLEPDDYLDIPEKALPITSVSIRSPRRLFLQGRSLPAEDQMRRGTCVAAAAIKVIDLLHGRDLSEQHLYNLAWKKEHLPGDTEDGITIKTAFDVMVQDGVVEEIHWRYVADSIPDNPPHDPVPNRVLRSPKFRIPKYRKLKPRGAISLAVTDALSTSKLPVVISSPVFFDEFSGWSDGLLLQEPQRGNPPDGYHAFIAVGYDLDDQFIIIQNSWGSNWGVYGTSVLPFDVADRLLDREIYSVQ